VRSALTKSTRRWVLRVLDSSVDRRDRRQCSFSMGSMRMTSGSVSCSSEPARRQFSVGVRSSKVVEIEVEVWLVELLTGQ
jgi:hypothetical protein